MDEKLDKQGEKLKKQGEKLKKHVDEKVEEVIARSASSRSRPFHQVWKDLDPIHNPDAFRFLCRVPPAEFTKLFWECVPDVSNEDLKESPIEAAAQKLSKHIREASFDLLAKTIDSPNVPMLGTRKPDVGLVPFGRPPHACNLVALGDYKRRKSHFADKDLGQVADFLLVLLEDHQPTRTFAFGFVSDLKRMQLVKLSRNANKTYLCEYSSLHLLSDDGLPLLYGLLSTAPDQLGWSLPVVPEGIVLIRGVGQGYSSIVFEASLQDQTYAVKTPAPGMVTLENELMTLRKLAGLNVPQVPTPHELSIPSCLILSPFATDLDTWLRASSRPKLPLKGLMLILTETLRLLHSHGLVHTDISLKNLLYTGDGKKEPVIT